MVICCPIHGFVHLTKDEKRVVDHPFLQRLRHIQQMGLGHYIFPGAVHSRFSHSLGCFHLAGLVFDQLLSNPQNSFFKAFSNEQLSYCKTVVKLAALLHDVGHAPLSHALDFLFPKNSDTGERFQHEEFTVRIIRHMMQEKDPVFSAEYATGVLALLNQQEPEADIFRANGINIFRLLSQLIASDIDVDRMDYLLRDSYYAGVVYGKFDLCQLHRFLLGWNIDGRIRLAIHHSALTTYEHFIWSRACLFVQVCFHKSLAGFTHFLKKAIAENEIQLSISEDLDQYLQFTDHQVYQSLAAAKNAFWAGKVWRRESAKVVLRAVNPDAQAVSLVEQAQKQLTASGIDHFFSNFENSFTEQTDQLNDASIGVFEDQFLQPKTYLLREKSQLLRSFGKVINVQQISVLPGHQTSALESLQPDLQAKQDSVNQNGLSFKH